MSRFGPEVFSFPCLSFFGGSEIRPGRHKEQSAAAPPEIVLTDCERPREQQEVLFLSGMPVE